MRLSKVDKGIQECTFRPAIMRKLSLPNQANNVSINKFDDHVDKMRAIRENQLMSKNTEEAKVGSGNLWNGKSTVTKEFSFGRAQSIKSLKRPVQVVVAENHKKYHDFYPKSELLGKVKEKQKGKNQVANVTIEIGSEMEESMSEIHKKIMNLEI